MKSQLVATLYYMLSLILIGAIGLSIYLQDFLWALAFTASVIKLALFIISKKGDTK